MYFIKRLSLLTLVLAFLFLFPKEASACTELSVIPSTAPIGTELTLNAFGCNPGVVDYAVFVITPDGDRIPAATISNVNSEGRASIPLGTPNLVGTHQVEVYLRTERLATTSFEVTENNDGENPPGPRPYRCNETVPFGTQTCSTQITTNCCPGACLISGRADGTYFCDPGQPYICGTSDGVGVETAIGCIPIEDINLTTEFFLRWALGVGGGIALFLISTSAIKIMTTKGDPKRLQDARDTLSAAIAGLVMIVLSVFLVRFFTETLLRLF